MGKSLLVLLVGIILSCSYIPINVHVRVSLTSQCPAMGSSLCKAHRWFQIYRTAPCRCVFFALAFGDCPRSHRQPAVLTVWICNILVQHLLWQGAASPGALWPLRV